jgi:pyruvate carboxylase subunit A
LDEYNISGVTTNIDFHKSILVHPEFVKGKLSTHFISDYYEFEESAEDSKVEAAAVTAALLEHQTRNKLTLSPIKKMNNSAWKLSGRPGKKSFRG